MKNIWHGIQIAVAVFGGGIGWFFGKLDGLLIALIAFAVMDYISGVLCAVMEHNLSSHIGFRGIAKKIFMFVLVGCANLLDNYIIGAGEALRTAVIFFFISNEGVSLLENSARLGLPIPTKLRDVLEILHDKAEGKEKPEEQKNDDNSADSKK